MKLHELYQADIDRRINPAVVVNEMDTYSVNQEIQEYVFTRDLVKSLYTLLKTLSDPAVLPSGKAAEGKTGIWVNGYYGSGKSHFIKYLYYCLQSDTRQQALSRLEKEHVHLVNHDPMFEPTPAELAAVQRNLAACQVETIIFNIDVVSKSKEGKEVITRVFLNRLNQQRGYNDANIALALYLEKPLDKAGHFDTFKQLIRDRLEDKWDGNQRRFIRSSLSSVLDIARELDPNLDADSLRHAIKEDGKGDSGYSVSDLIEEFQDYLADKDDNFRMVFLVDEVSQYIGSDTSLLLNLQSIVEELGIYCGRKVWLTCTAQQELGYLIEHTAAKGEDFGKILGRFETRISLESQSAAHITKKRVLEKSPEAVQALTKLYQQNKSAIDNQFFFENDLYDGYESPDDFFLTYPFVPYQFRLISDVFESFSQVGYVGEGVRNTERSILGITHFTARCAKDEELPYFVPFDLFFNDELEKNLTHFARELLARAYNIKSVQQDRFARRVVNALFMVSNISEAKKDQFPPTLDNLSVLLIDQLDQPRHELQTRIQQVLDDLARQNVIRESEGQYRFLKEEEIEVANAISHTNISLNDRLEALDKYFLDFFGRKFKQEYGGNTFQLRVAVDDKEIVSRGDLGLRFSILDTEDPGQMALRLKQEDLVFCLHPWHNQDEAFRQDFNRFVQTAKYITENGDRVAGSKAEVLHKFRKQNELLRRRLHARFVEAFVKAPVISAQQVLPGDQFGTSPERKYEAALQHHLGEVFKKQSLSRDFARNRNDLLEQARQARQTDIRGLTPAEEEVLSRIQLLGSHVNLDELVRHYERPPYGWPHTATIDIVLRLAQANKRRIEWRNQELHQWTEYVEKALNSAERKAVFLVPGLEVSTDKVLAFKDAVNRIFSRTLIRSNSQDARVVAEAFKEALKNELQRAHQRGEECAGLPFARHLRDFHQLLKELYEEREPQRLIDRVVSQERELRDQRDRFVQIADFVETQLQRYREIREYVQERKRSFELLSPEARQRAADLAHYFQTQDEPADQFPWATRFYDTLRQDLEAALRELRDQAISSYEQAYDRLESELRQTCEELELDYHQHLLLPRDNKLSELAKSQDLSWLQSQHLLSPDFETEQRTRIIEYREKIRTQRAAEENDRAGQSGRDTPAPPEPPRSVETFSLSEASSLPREIAREEDLQDLLEKLGAHLRQRLAEGKIILLK